MHRLFYFLSRAGACLKHGSPDPLAVQYFPASQGLHATAAEPPAHPVIPVQLELSLKLQSEIAVDYLEYVDRFCLIYTPSFLLTLCLPHSSHRGQLSPPAYTPATGPQDHHALHPRVIVD